LFRTLRRVISSVLGFTLFGYGTTWAISANALDVFADSESGKYAHPYSWNVFDDVGTDCDQCYRAAPHML
jgi:hypothetical protein